jgi:hypothetical protein
LQKDKTTFALEYSMKSGIAPALAMAFCAWLGGVVLFFGGGLLQVTLKASMFDSFNDWIFLASASGHLLAP